MHGQVDLAAGQRFAKRTDEDAGAADLSQLRPADIAERRHPDDLHRPAGALGDHVGHLARLRDGHRALTAAEPQRTLVHPCPPLTAPRPAGRMRSHRLLLTREPPAPGRRG